MAPAFPIPPRRAGSGRPTCKRRLMSAKVVRITAHSGFMRGENLPLWYNQGREEPPSHGRSTSTMSDQGRPLLWAPRSFVKESLSE